MVRDKVTATMNRLSTLFLKHVILVVGYALGDSFDSLVGFWAQEEEKIVVVGESVFGPNKSLILLLWWYWTSFEGTKQMLERAIT